MINRRLVLVDLLAVAGLAVLAAVLRADRFMTVPAFTDETQEVLLALDWLAAGGINLVGVSFYLGGLSTWLLMLLFWLGAPVEAPRLLSLALGVLTVLATYGLGRELGGRPAALLAGGLLATNLPHVVVNSHIAWSHCLTPFFTTVALWLASRALRRDQPALLPPAALVLGLGLQTHPIAVIVVPGLAAGVLLTAHGRRWLGTGWPWLALAAGAVAYANMLWHLLSRGGQTLAEARSRDYAFHPAASPAEWLEILGALGLQLARLIGSSFAPAVGQPTYPITVTLVGVTVLASIGAVAAPRRGQAMVPLMVVSGAALMALIGGEYQPLPHGSVRFLMPLVPAIFALAGLGAVQVGRWLAARSSRLTGTIAVGLLGLALVTGPVLTLRQYLDWYSAHPWLGGFNTFALVVGDLATREWTGPPVYLDTSLHVDASSDAGTLHRALVMVIRARGGEVASLRRSQRQTLRSLREQIAPDLRVLVLRRDLARQLASEGAVLTPIGDASRVIDPAVGEVRLYRLE
jgi:4-amino-4-deoxy-L-arabinose transferase-like glycosyltransferase